MTTKWSTNDPTSKNSEQFSCNHLPTTKTPICIIQHPGSHSHSSKSGPDAMTSHIPIKNKRGAGEQSHQQQLRFFTVLICSNPQTTSNLLSMQALHCILWYFCRCGSASVLLAERLPSPGNKWLALQWHLAGLWGGEHVVSYFTSTDKSMTSMLHSYKSIFLCTGHKKNICIPRLNCRNYIFSFENQTVFPTVHFLNLVFWAKSSFIKSDMRETNFSYTLMDINWILDSSNNCKLFHL